jgi:hypothetical protein
MGAGVSRFGWEAYVNLRFAYVAALGLLWTIAPANAGPYVVTLQQEGANVVARGSGSIDVTGLSFLSEVNNGVFVSSAQIQMVGGNASTIDAYEKISAITPSFGNWGGTRASSGSGDNVGFHAGGGGAYEIFVPHNYVSDTSLSGIATYDNATLASLGLALGTYTLTWGTDPNQSFTLHIVATPSHGALPPSGASAH